MTDPLPIFANHLDGLYRRFPIHLADDAVRLGWIPVPGYIRTLCDEYVVWFRWIECACGRAMPVPR
jgi:hypothetical protein